VLRQQMLDGADCARSRYAEWYLPICLTSMLHLCATGIVAWVWYNRERW